ncbi:MAG: hypothetical protein WA621_18015 [Candidatus Acidiferrum sp.]
MSAEIEFGGTRMIGDEALFFALVERVELGAVDRGHGDKEKIARMQEISKQWDCQEKGFYTEGTESSEHAEKGRRIIGGRG